MRNDILINKLNSLIEPIVVEKNYELYQIEFVQEGGEHYLRVYIDKEDGIALEDCEKVSRAVSDMLDVEDPISQAYYLEVSSPGIFRELYNDKHYAKYIGYKVDIKLTSSIEGKKQFEGKLLSYNDVEIVVATDNADIIIPKNKIKRIQLKGDL